MLVDSMLGNPGVMATRSGAQQPAKESQRHLRIVGSGSLSNTRFLGPTRVNIWITISSGAFAGLTVVANRQTTLLHL